MNFWDLIPPDSRKPVELASRCEVRILTKNHKERWLDITATPIDFDGEQSRLFSAFDLTGAQTSGIAGTTPGYYGPPYWPGQLPSASRRTPRRDRTIRAHGTTVCRFAARLGWAEEDQRLLRPLGRQPGTMPRRRCAPFVLSGYRYSRAIRGRRVCRRAARDSGRSRRACRVSHSQSACNG